MTDAPSIASLVATASASIFDKPLVTNVYRSVLAEALVAAALPGWTWCSGDYHPYDFLHESGLRLEVKQSALRQTWFAGTPSSPSWDIAPRSGYWSDGAWVARPGRNADIYVLALHAVAEETADHRDAGQWLFHVLASTMLPPTRRLTWAGAGGRVDAVPFDGLAHEVQAVMASIQGHADLCNLAGNQQNSR